MTPNNVGDIDAFLADHVLSPDFPARQPMRFIPKTDRRFLDLMGWRSGVRVVDVFTPDSDAYKAVAERIGSDHAAVARRMWEHAAAYRVRNCDALHIPNAVVMLYAYVHAVANGFAVDKFIDDEAKGVPVGPGGWAARPRAAPFPGQAFFARELIGMLLDEESEASCGGLYARVTAGLETKLANSGGCEVPLPLAEALASSNRKDAHGYLARLQLGNLLPETYRIALWRAALSGTPGAKIAMLEASSSWYYYQSIQQCFCENIRVGFDRIDYAFWGERGFELAAHLLSNRGAAARALGGDPQLVHMGLWALAKDDLPFALKQCDDLLAGRQGQGDPNNKYAALYWLWKLNNLTLGVRHAAPLLADPEHRADPVAMALTLRCLGLHDDHITMRRYRNVVLTDLPGEMYPGMGWALFITKDELERLHQALRAAADEAGKNGWTQRGGRFTIYQSMEICYGEGDIIRLEECWGGLRTSYIDVESIMVV